MAILNRCVWRFQARDSGNRAIRGSRFCAAELEGDPMKTSLRVWSSLALAICNPFSSLARRSCMKCRRWLEGDPMKTLLRVWNSLALAICNPSSSLTRRSASMGPSRDVIISSQICVLKMQRFFTLGDGCGLPNSDCLVNVSIWFGVA